MRTFTTTLAVVGCLLLANVAFATPAPTTHCHSKSERIEAIRLAIESILLPVGPVMMPVDETSWTTFFGQFRWNDWEDTQPQDD